MDNGTAVMVRDLHKSYRDVEAVRGIDLGIARGEVFALLGPNGAGKTTTVEILEGFRRRDHGTVDVLGQDPARAGRAWRARIGMVFVVIISVIGAGLDAWHHPGLPGALTALGILAFAVTFSYVYSRWMARVIDQSLERAELIRQLESTRAELAAAHHEAGVLAERHRLAGEIHDTLAQGFTSIVTLVQAAEASLDATSPARRHLDLALATARENLAEARALVTALTPAALRAGGLADTVHRVTGATGAQAGIEAHAEVTGTARRLPTGTEVVLLRVCQEALANVRKHAAARRVSVRLCYADGAVRLTVADDGRGFDPSATNGGYGLNGMRDRVRQVGGTVEVDSAPGRGTKVSAEVPG